MNDATRLTGQSIPTQMPAQKKKQGRIAWRATSRKPTNATCWWSAPAAAGMSAAVTAGHHGLKVLIVEKEPRFGGTTARSGGWLWIPGTSLAKAWGIVEEPGTGANLSAPRGRQQL